MKRNFTFKYEMIRKQITDINQMNTIASCDNILSRNEKHKYNVKNDVPYIYLSKDEKRNKTHKMLSSTIERKQNENPFHHQLYKAKVNLLTGKDLDNIDFKINKRIDDTQENNYYDSQTYKLNKAKTLRNLRNIVKKRPEIRLNNKMFQERGKENKNYFVTYNTDLYNKNIVNKLKVNFPEYTHRVNSNGIFQSFITDPMKQKVNRLKRSLDKINNF